MLVSIVVNNFNYARFLPESIESALRQTHRSVEVVVVDDGSSDESRQVIEGYGDRVRAVYKSNGGQGSALNVGFAACRGDVICFLDADDVLVHTAVERFLPSIQEPGVSKAQWALRVIDAGGVPTGRTVPDDGCVDGDLRAWVIENGPLYDLRLTPSGSAAAFPRRFLDAVLPMPEAPFVNGADVYLTTLAPAFGRIRTVPGFLGSYRWHGGNLYLGRALDEARLANYVARFEANATALADHLRRQGQDVDTAAWRERNYNSVWPRRLLRARRDIAERLPEGSRFVRIDDNEWASTVPIAGRPSIPFLERGGEFWGPPADDATALAELERLRREGAGFLVVWWPAFWWLETYPRLAAHLASLECLLDEDHLLVFDLGRPATTPQPNRLRERLRESASSPVAYPPAPVVGARPVATLPSELVDSRRRRDRSRAHDAVEEPNVPSPPVAARVLRGFDDPALEPGRWDALLAKGDTDSIAITWDYQRTWWDCFGRGRLLLILASHGEQPIALAPWFADGGMVFSLCPEDFLDVVGDVGEAEVLDALLLTARAQVPDFVGFRFYFVPDRSRTGARLQAAAKRLEFDCFDEGALPAPALDIAGQPEVARDAARKKSLLRHERGFRREGELLARHFREAEEVLPQLPAFFEQHIARRAALGEKSIFLDSASRSFYEKIVRRGAPRGWIRFTRVDWCGRPIAFHFGLRYGARYLYAIPTFDVRLARRSPGEVLLRHLLLAAIEEGAGVFDFGIGGEAYKYRFATHENWMRTWGLYPRAVP